MFTQNSDSNNIVVITGSQTHHRYFVDRLNSRFQLSAVFYENYSYPSPEHSNSEDQKLWDWYFDRRKKYEEKIFKSFLNGSFQNQATKTTLQSGEIHSKEFINHLKELNPGFIAIFGTSIFKKPYLDIFSSMTFNLHLGLPQFYRGSSCNFWPLYDLKPEHMGATVHQIDSGIDTGKIAGQKNISLDEYDDEQTLSGKTILAGVQIMIDVIDRWRTGKLDLKPSDIRGKLYKKSDFKVDSIRKVKEYVQSGNLRRRIIELNSKEQ